MPNVETHICRESEGLQYTLAHLHELVVKPVAKSGGYGIVDRPARLARARTEGVPRPAEGQPGQLHQPADGRALGLVRRWSTAAIEPRHVDLRPFVITGRETWVLPGGLTRVALPPARWW